MHWRVDGAPGAPALLLIHGLCESLRCWERVVPMLSDRFRVVRVDLFGFGDSPSGGGLAIEAQARGVGEALSEAGVGEAVVVGHSLGGAVAIALADGQPERVRSLVLINSAPTVESRTLSAAERALRTPVAGRAAWKLMGDRERRAGLRSAFAPGAEVPELFVEDLRRTSYEAYLESTIGFDAYLAACSLPDRVRELGIRTLVIFGVEDRRVDAAGIDAFDQLGNATVERLPAVGHSPMWEAPDDVAALLERAAT